MSIGSSIEYANVTMLKVAEKKDNKKRLRKSLWLVEGANIRFPKIRGLLPGH